APGSNPGTLIDAPADVGTDPTHSAALGFFQSYDPNSCPTPKCYLNVSPILVDPGDGPTHGRTFVIDLPISQQVQAGAGTTRINLALLEMNDLASLRLLFAGQTVTVAGQQVTMTADQRTSLLGQPSIQTGNAIDINGDHRNDLDQNRDGIWDGQDDFTP